MADIKTRQRSKGNIKTIDRVANLSSRVRAATVRTKEQTPVRAETEDGNEVGYASENTISAAGHSLQSVSHAPVSGMQAVWRKGVRKPAGTEVGSRRVKTELTRAVKSKSERSLSGNVHSSYPGRFASSRPHRAEQNNKVPGQPNRSQRALVPVREGKSIKTGAVKPGEKETLKAGKKEAARRATTKAKKKTADEVKDRIKRTVKLSYHAMRASIAGAKTMAIAAIATGGTSVLIILVFVLLGSAFYFFGDESSSNYTSVSAEVEAYSPVIQKYAQEYGIPEYIDLIKAVMMQESGGKGTDPMQAAEGAFNTKYPKKPNGITDPDYSIRCGVQELKAALTSAGVLNPLDMEHIRLALQGYNYGNGYITWAIQRDGGYTVENAAAFSEEQAKKHGWSSYGDKQYVAHVLRYYPYGNYNIGVGNTKITQVAAQQIGNVGGKKYWSWYGFNTHVEWCACFVSWCADQCGYLESGIIPKFASVTEGARWFKDKNQWQRSGYHPAPGDIIFFDWKADGTCDHVGIVEKSDDETVYTIEGNSLNMCRRKSYPINSMMIYGYGVPKY